MITKKSELKNTKIKLPENKDIRELLLSRIYKIFVGLDNEETFVKANIYNKSLIISEKYPMTCSVNAYFDNSKYKEIFANDLLNEKEINLFKL